MINISSRIRYYDKKYICSGHVIEEIKYSLGVCEGYDSKATGKCSSDNKKRSDNINKSKVKLRRLINSNVTGNDLFVTLTYANNMTDINKAKYDFKIFIKAMKRKGYSLKYVYVVEFQKRGAVHFHVIFFNMKYISNEFLSSVWKHGFVRINRIDDVDNVGAYVVKYMQKDLMDDRLINKDLYGRSRGLNEPIEIKDPQEVQLLEETLSSDVLVYENTYTSDYHGLMSYKQYNLKRCCNQESGATSS